MEMLFKTSLWIHILSGMTALFCGLLAIAAQKGGLIHRRAGLVFFYAMLAVSISALVMALPKGNLGLVYIGLFAFYQNMAGYRATRNKAMVPKGWDWALAALGGINGVFMVLSFKIVLVVFGSISLMLALGDLRMWWQVTQGKALDKRAWLRQHIGMMMGTYIATTTAFVVVNVQNVQPSWLPWLLPTALGVPYLAWMSRKHAPRAKKIQNA